jgi:uncharacterized protein
VIYLDSSALVKLVHPEPEAQALQRFLAAKARVPKISSALVYAELQRAIRRVNHDAAGRARDDAALTAELELSRELLETLRMVEVTRSLLADAGAVSIPRLRSLDAIHLVSAMRVATGMSAFVTYDKRLAAAAKETGLPVAVPA